MRTGKKSFVEDSFIDTDEFIFFYQIHIDPEPEDCLRVISNSVDEP